MHGVTLADQAYLVELVNRTSAFHLELHIMCHAHMHILAQINHHRAILAGIVMVEFLLVFKMMVVVWHNQWTGILCYNIIYMQIEALL